MTRSIRIMLADDEPNILEFLEMGLRMESYEVRSAPDGAAAVDLAKQFRPHVAILDVMMPGMDGFEVCERLKDTEEVSVIMLTAKDEVDDRVKGLRLGADDYMMKPFSFEELLARIEARVRNRFPHLLGAVTYGAFRIDDKRREIALRDEPLGLSPTEYELLAYLIANHSIVLSKPAILDRVWGYDFAGEDNIVEVYVRSLRDKLGDREHRIIRTLRGAGYRLDLP